MCLYYPIADGACSADSELVVHDLYQVSDLLVLACLHEPFTEIALNSDVQHLFLLARQPRRFNLLLHLEELFRPQLHHLDKLRRAKEQISFTEFSRQRHLRELKRRNQL